MPNNEYPTLDGIAPSWADVKVRGNSGGTLIEMVDIAAVNTGVTVEVGEQVGASGGRKLKTTTGKETPEASITLYRSGFQNFLRALKARAPLRGNQRLISLVHFDIQFMHTPPGSDEIFEVRIMGCRVVGRTMNDAEGTEAQKVEVPLNVKYIADMIDDEEVVML